MPRCASCNCLKSDCPKRLKGVRAERLESLAVLAQDQIASSSYVQMEWRVPMSCIFCRSEERLTREHVFPAFMGGELAVVNASCETCNGIVGVAEASIRDATVPLLNLLRIENRDGRVPNAPLRADIQGLDLQDLPAFMDGNGEIRLRDFVRDTVTAEGRQLRQGFFVTREAGERFAERNRARGGEVIPRDVPRQIVIEAEYVQDVMFAFSLEARKVAAKIALTAIAFNYGVPFAQSPQFDALRQIRDEQDSRNLPVRLFANENVMAAWLRTPYQHSVLCYLSAGMRKGWALVTLFGGLSYIVEVTRDYGERESRQFSIFYEADRRARSNPILLADEMALIGHVLSPATTFESPLAVDAQWYRVVAAFCSCNGTVVERLADRPPLNQ